jgi:hypothetical protein
VPLAQTGGGDHPSAKGSPSVPCAGCRRSTSASPVRPGFALRWVILLLAAVNLAAGHRELALERRAESGRAALVLAVAVDVVSVDHHVQLI